MRDTDILTQVIRLWALAHLLCCSYSVTVWTVACQAPLSMGFFGQVYWSGLPFAGFQGSNLHLLCHLQLQADPLPLSHWEPPPHMCINTHEKWAVKWRKEKLAWVNQPKEKKGKELTRHWKRQMEMGYMVGEGKSFLKEHAILEDDCDQLKGKIITELLSSFPEVSDHRKHTSESRRSGSIKSHFWASWILFLSHLSLLKLCSCLLYLKASVSSDILREAEISWWSEY